MGGLYKCYTGDILGEGFGAENMVAKDGVWLEGWNGMPCIHCTHHPILEVSSYLRIPICF